MPYHLWMGNIVNIATDAIVNAANTELKRTPGICEAIFAAADSAKLEEACRPTKVKQKYLPPTLV